jgi:hypothetical protein
VYYLCHGMDNGRIMVGFHEQGCEGFGRWPENPKIWKIFLISLPRMKRHQNILNILSSGHKQLLRSGVK